MAKHLEDARKNKEDSKKKKGFFERLGSIRSKSKSKKRIFLDPEKIKKFRKAFRRGN